MLVLVCAVVFAAPLFEMGPANVDSFLAGLDAGPCQYGARVASVARAAVGTPYVGDPLGEGPGAPYDGDPLIDLSKVDCVTFVEQVIALAASKSYQEASDILQKIRYRGGAVAFENRNHFMEADWIGNNTFCKDVTGSLGVATEKSTRTLGRKHFYTVKKIDALASKAVDQELTLEYVPVNSAAPAEAKLPSPALVLLIGKVDWLFTLHCGLYIRDDSGNGLFYQASSKFGKVVAVPFTDMFKDTNRYVGFSAYRIEPPCGGGGVVGEKK